MSFWEILSKTVQTILIMSATGSVITLVLFGLKPIIKNHLPQKAQYYLWLLALLAFLVPFASFVSLPFNTPMTPVQRIITTNVKSTVEWQEEIAQEVYGMPYAELNAIEQVNVSYSEFKARNIGNYNFLLPYVLILGVAYFLKEVIIYSAYLLSLKGSRLPARKNELNLLPKRSPGLFRNSLAETPMLVGIFRPIIYLPDREYSQQQLKNIMLHELMHWQRHDIIIKWLVAISVCMHWLNPFAYFMRREIDKACELACDEAVITGLDAHGKQSYGDTLIEMATDFKKSKVIMSTTLCEEKKTLKDRLGAIMRSKKPTKAVIQLSFVLLVILLGTIILLGSSSNYNDYHGMQWAKKLQAQDIAKIELVVQPSAKNESYRLFKNYEFADVVELVNQSHGIYLNKPQSLYGQSIVFYITTKDGVRHTFSNVGNTYLILDGITYKAEYDWLSSWKYTKGNAKLPSTFSFENGKLLTLN